MHPLGNSFMVWQTMCHLLFDPFPHPPFSFLTFKLPIKACKLLPLKMLNLLQHMKTYNSLACFLEGTISPTPQLRSQFLFSCGPQECSSHSDGKPTTNKLFFPCKKSHLTNACVSPLDLHNRNQRPLA